MTVSEPRQEDSKSVSLNNKIKNFYMFNAFRSMLEEKEKEEKKKQKQIENDLESLDPFIGPRPFSRELEDQFRFFGRDDETEEIISLILGHKAILIYAQSGAGKTSIFEAEVVPELNRYGFEVLPRARVGIASASERQEEQKAGSKLPIHSFADKSLDEFLTAYLSVYSPNEKKNSANAPVVLVFDQFEELFTTFPPSTSNSKSGIDLWMAQREDFFKQVANVLENESRRVHVVFIIREEFLAALDRFVKFIPERLKPRFRLERLHKDAAIEAIKEPLKRTKSKRLFQERNIRQEDVDKIIDSTVTSLLKIRVEDPTPDNPNKISIVEGEYVEPIQLQVVCQSRFSKWDPEKKENRDQSRTHKLNWLRSIWFRLYPQKDDKDQAQTDKESEDVDRALREFYEEAVDKASEETNINEEDIRKLFNRKFITTSGTRSFVNNDDVVEVISHKKGSQSFIFLLSNELRNWLGIVKKNRIGERTDHQPNLRVSRLGKEKTEGRRKEEVLMNSLKESYVVRGEQRIGGASWYELTHDRLIGPIKDSNTEWERDKNTKKYKRRLTIVSSVFIAIIAALGVSYLFNASQSNAIACAEIPRMHLIDVRQFPDDLVLNPRTQEVYVGSGSENGMYSVISCENHNVQTNKSTPTYALAIDPEENNLYAVSPHSNQLYIIDGSSTNNKNNDKASGVTVGAAPTAIAINQDTNRIYVANEDSNTVSVIDSINNKEVGNPVKVGAAPTAIAINQDTNRIYVANEDSNTVSVIDVGNDTVEKTFHLTFSPNEIEINPEKNLLYVSTKATTATREPHGYVLLIDLKEYDPSQEPGPTSLQVEDRPVDLAVNTNTDMLYVTNYCSNTVSVIDINNNSTNEVIPTIKVGQNPRSIAVNNVTNKIYVANEWSNTTSVIDGTTNKVVANVAVGARPTAIAINQDTNRIYVANEDSNTVLVIDGSTNNKVIENVTIGAAPAAAIAIDQGTRSNIEEILKENPETTCPAVNSNTPIRALNLNTASIAVNQDTNRIYVANEDSNTLFVIDGTNNEVVKNETLNISPQQLAIDPLKKLIYMADFKIGKVASVNEDSISINNTVEIADLNNPIGISLNLSDNTVYVANFDDNRISIICNDDLTQDNSGGGFGQDNSGGGFGQDNSGGGIDQRLEKAFRSLNNDCQQQQQNQEDFSTIPLPPGSKPLSIAFDSEHNKLYATNVKGNTVLIMDVDPEAMEATEREEIIDMVR
jgi:YVTN family beta-propeller protein